MRVKYIRQITAKCFIVDEKVNILSALGHNLVNHSVFQCFLGGHPVVAVSIGKDLVKRLATVLRNDAKEFLSVLFNLTCLDENVLCLTFHSAKRLVDHHSGVWQGTALAFGTCTKENAAHGGGHTGTDGGHIRSDNLHGVVYAQTIADAATWRIQV